jgi:pimeloyl-ACP methyl ester carboxylesterase
VRFVQDKPRGFAENVSMRASSVIKYFKGHFLALVALAATSTVAVAVPGDTLYTQRGERISIGSGRLNFYCIGSGSPTVVFDAGFGDWSPAWAAVQPRVGRWTRACAYDRAGYAFSDPAVMPRTSLRIAEELHAALHDASISPPYVLVAHAFGSYNMRVFADRYMQDVAGIVLVDADDGDVEPAKWQARDHKAFLGIIADLRKCRNALPERPPRTCDGMFFRGLPEARFSMGLNAMLLHFARTQVSLYDATISEMEEMPGDETYLKQHVTSYGSRPIRVLTTWHFGRPPSSPPSVHSWHVAFEHDSALAQGSWLRLSTNARQIFDYDVTHQYIQLDDPRVVLKAIREVLDTISGS